MRTSAVISTLAVTLCVVSGSAHAETGSVTRALAQSQSLGSSSNDTAALEALQKYLGNGTNVENLSPEETKKLLEKLNEDAKSDSSLKAILTSLKLDAETIAKYTEKTFKSIGNTLTTLFSGSIKPVQVDGSKDSDEGVFSNVWNSLFGKKKKTEDTTAKPSTGSGSGSGGLGEDVGSGSEASPAIASEDTSIQTAAPEATTTKPAATKPAASSSRAKFLTSLPVAGALAAVVVINFW